MNRRLFPLFLVILLVAVFAGPASPILASHESSSSGHSDSPRPAGDMTPPSAEPAAEPAIQRAVRPPDATRYLVLVPDIDGFYYAPWATDFYWSWPNDSPLGPYGTWYAPPSPYLDDEGYLEVESSGNHAALDLHVHPRMAEVDLDGKPLGPAKHHDRWSDRIPLDPGEHVVEMKAPGFRTLQVNLDAQQGEFYSLHYRLKRGKGLDPRSPKDPAAMNPLGPAPSVKGEASSGEASTPAAPAPAPRTGR